MSSTHQPPSPIQATDAGGVTGVAVPAGSQVVVQDAPKDPGAAPDHWAWRYAISAVMELKDGAWALSIGRTLLLTLFVHAVLVWSTGRDIADHEMGTLYGLLAYVLSSKITGVVQQWQK